MKNNILLTEFGEKLDKNSVLSEYPRPQLVRDSYINLNGEWDYAICKKADYDTLVASDEAFIQGKILVPFSPECLLSGVQKILQPDEILYYKRQFVIPQSFIKSRVILHFGAVDYSCVVIVNGQQAGKNKGGYFAFSFDITDLINEGENTIEVLVEDPSDTDVQSRGKQKLKPGGIWYTPSSGIWQTVWLESVEANYIKNLKITPDIDKNTVTIELDTAQNGYEGDITVLFDKKEVARADITSSKIEIALSDIELWSPENPNLYDVKINYFNDQITSYFGMRKFSKAKDKNGVLRLFLNNKPYFHNGLLDQGYYSDGMYTAASDEALIFDIETAKKAGFNMLRKHIKIEPMRWYYHCDRLGILVWQDMVNGGGDYNLVKITVLPFLGIRFDDRKYEKNARGSSAGRDEFVSDLERTIDALYNVTSLAVWVPFNEGWGQFDANKMAEYTRKLDPTRQIDHASGWHDQGGGDFDSIHVYFKKIKIPKLSNRVIAVTEFGGYSYRIEGHIYNPNRNFGYRVYKEADKFEAAYEDLFDKQITANIKKGLSAAVYTQLSDVEDESNGIVTYDRRELKADLDFFAEVNKRVYEEFNSLSAE